MNKTNKNRRTANFLNKRRRIQQNDTSSDSSSNSSISGSGSSSGYDSSDDYSDSISNSSSDSDSTGSSSNSRTESVVIQRKKKRSDPALSLLNKGEKRRRYRYLAPVFVKKHLSKLSSTVDCVKTLCLFFKDGEFLDIKIVGKDGTDYSAIYTYSWFTTFIDFMSKIMDTKDVSAVPSDAEKAQFDTVIPNFSTDMKPSLSRMCFKHTSFGAKIKIPIRASFGPVKITPDQFMSREFDHVVARSVAVPTATLSPDEIRKRKIESSKRHRKETHRNYTWHNFFQTMSSLSVASAIAITWSVALNRHGNASCSVSIVYSADISAKLTIALTEKWFTLFLLHGFFKF